MGTHAGAGAVPRDWGCGEPVPEQRKCMRRKEQGKKEKESRSGSKKLSCTDPASCAAPSKGPAGARCIQPVAKTRCVVGRGLGLPPVFVSLFSFHVSQTFNYRLIYYVNWQ